MKIIRTGNFTIFTVYATIFGQFMGFFIFSNHIGEIAHFTLELLKTFDYKRHPGPTKKVLQNKRSIHYKWSIIKYNSIKY